jgi:hypothetical protein
VISEPTSEVALSLRERILARDDRQYESVHIPEWDEMVRVRGLTGTERDRWEASMMRQDGSRHPQVNLDNLRAKLVALTMVDEQGRRVFRDSDVPALGDMSASALQRIFEVAQRLSRLTDQDVEELTGNSSGETSAENGFGSPATSASP